MKLITAQRQSAKIKLAIQGPSGSGKTMSSLLLAYGLCEDWNKVAVIDTENGSSNLYSSLGPFLVLKLDPPCSPERYIQAIDTCVKANASVIIIDGISPCWEFLLNYHSNLTGNSFTNWAKVTPRQNAFVQAVYKLMLMSSVR
jgi:adenylylsulfate kinase-like enzyme